MRRRRKPDYRHIAQLEAELGVVKTVEPPKRDMVPVTHRPIAQLAWKLDPSGALVTDGQLVEHLRPMALTSATASIPLRPGFKWPVDHHDDVRAYVPPAAQKPQVIIARG